MTQRKFGVLILTHGRPDNVLTYGSLQASGYTGPTYIVIDNEDAKADRYIERFGKDNVFIFDKKAMADKIDEGNNFDDRRVIVHARNASFDVAEHFGLTHFVQLDDDYNSFLYRDEKGARTIRDIDEAFSATCDFLDDSGADSVAWSQGGDHIGGFAGIRLKRKAMNSFFCRTDRRFTFYGSINEDVNVYACEGMRGKLFFTFTGLQLNQAQTQSQGGGMTDIYLQRGTYVKSFTTVLYCPSSVSLSMMGRTDYRIHHLVNWKHTVPCIVSESFKKA